MFLSGGLRRSTSSHSCACGAGAGDAFSVRLISTSRSMLFFLPTLVSSCLSSLVLSCPSTSLISPTFISPHVIHCFHAPSSSSVCFVSSYFFLLSPQFPTVSSLLRPSLHTPCLLMGFDKGILDQLLAAPAACADTYSHPALVRTLPFSYTLVKGQLLKM